MRQILLILFASLIFSTLNARAQIMNDRYDELTVPMDIVGEQHLNDYADQAWAGDEERKKSQEERYKEMVEPVDQANIRHFHPIPHVKVYVEDRLTSNLEDFINSDLDTDLPDYYGKSENSPYP